ncbi:MAG TPA: MlaD family protein [Gemmatimonadaceae bacterium]|nr:MlaD family protein [Gemmatimonadaceae bacterium]
MSTRRTNDFIVGLAVIIGVALIIAATLWVRESDLGGTKSQIEARFHSVGNAQVGNAVVVRGVRAGRIEAMELAPGGWVAVRLRIDEGIELPPDPVVLLGQSSLFGDWQATITERSALPNDRDLRRQVEEAAAPGMIPGATLPDVAQLTAVAGRIAGDVASVADRVQIAFDDSAARELRASIRNFADLSAELARTVRRQSENLDVITGEVGGGVHALRAAAVAMERVAERVDSSTSGGEVDSIVSDAAVAAAQLRDAATELRRLSGGLGATQARLDSLLVRSEAVAARVERGDGTLGLLVRDSSLYVQSDSLVRELRSLVRDVKANPRRYVNLSIF